MEKYSVLMSIYGKERPAFFRLAIESMINQTVKPDEIVLVEDGPLTKDLYSVIKEYEQYLTIVKNQSNLGLGLALKKGLLVCKNELIARMDTDDIAIYDRCEKELHFLQKNPTIAVVGGQIEEFVGNPDNVVGKRVVPCTDKRIKQYIKRRCPFNHMTVMFRKSDVLQVGNYKEWQWNEDYYLWIRLAIAGKQFANIPDTLVKVRTGKDFYQRRGGLSYFISEKNLQIYMLENNLINPLRFCINVAERFVLQLMLPNRIRGIIFRTIARK